MIFYLKLSKEISVITYSQQNYFSPKQNKNSLKKPHKY